MLIYATVLNFRWRLVIHGGIDGFSRMIVFLKCSTNNLVSTVLDCFVQAVRIFGLPSGVVRMLMLLVTCSVTLYEDQIEVVTLLEEAFIIKE